MKHFLVFSVLVFSSFAFSQMDSVSVVSDTVGIQEDTLAFSPNNDKIDNIISTAKKYLGIPYKYAGTSPAGFDCSGFLFYVFKKYDINVSRTSASMANYGKRITLAEARKGDLMFFKGSRLSSPAIGHVGMVTENNDGVIKFIHSANGGVQITTFNGSKYYVPRFIMVRRLEY